jgi:hypothetical protein
MAKSIVSSIVNDNITVDRKPFCRPQDDQTLLSPGTSLFLSVSHHDPMRRAHIINNTVQAPLEPILQPPTRIPMELPRMVGPLATKIKRLVW